MIIPLTEAIATTCGAKAASLGALSRAGLPVPDGFVIPFDAYPAVRDRQPDHVGTGTASSPRISTSTNTRVGNGSGTGTASGTGTGSSTGSGSRAGNGSETASRPLPAELLDSLAHALGRLGDVPVAVRSSANSEDTVHASGAGQHESVLAVRGVPDIAAAVRTCWDSLHSSRAIAYRNDPGANQPPPDEPAMAVLVQRLVDADISGVMFTSTGEGPTEIEASWGLGPTIVGGTVTPDAYRVAPDGTITRTIANKQTRLDRADTHPATDPTADHDAQPTARLVASCGERVGGGLVVSEVSAVDRGRATLDDATVARLVLLGQRVAAVLGGPQDIEWAIAGRRIWILQARPITATPPQAPSETPVASPTVLTGTPASHGLVAGTARIVRGPADFPRVRPGDIIVCPYTDPAWTPLLRIAAGVLTETGGVLSHAAIVARELHIPAILGIPNATTWIHDGATITINGTTGTVTTTVPDGTVTTAVSDGTVTTAADDAGTTAVSDGTVTTAADGAGTTAVSDGAGTTAVPDGTVTTTDT